MLAIDENKGGKPKGKIYVLHNSADKALIGSGIKNGIDRIGRYGPYAHKNWWGRVREVKDRVHSEIRGYVEGVDYARKLSYLERQVTHTHNYEFHPKATEFYVSKKV